MTPPAALATDAALPQVPLRTRIVATAIVLTTDSGWSTVTMSRLAAAVGVSRQTVYVEVGTKAALAEAMVRHELDGFLALVDAAFRSHDGDLLASVRAATRGVLELAAEHPLLRAIVAGSGGTDLLPPLTTRSTTVVDAARLVLAERVTPYVDGLEPTQLAAAVDAIVRVVLSHVMSPSAPPARTADDVAWLAGRLLAPPRTLRG